MLKLVFKNLKSNELKHKVYKNKNLMNYNLEYIIQILNLVILKSKLHYHHKN